VLERMDSPYLFLKAASKKELLDTFRNFKHRFTTGEELAMMLYGIKKALERHGSLHTCFSESFKLEHETIIPALSSFVKELSSVFQGKPRSLLPSPDAGSACKRLNLFLRWMVRHDDVDPGGWDNIPASRLIIPLDIHMHRISLHLGLTKRKQADLKAARWVVPVKQLREKAYQSFLAELLLWLAPFEKGGFGYSIEQASILLKQIYQEQTGGGELVGEDRKERRKDLISKLTQLMKAPNQPEPLHSLARSTLALIKSV